MTTEALLAIRQDLQSALDRVDLLIGEASTPDTDFIDLQRTVAIERVLADHDGHMRPIEIWAELQRRGRNDPKMEVQVTTFDLWERGRIGKVGRGQYVSTPDGDR